MHGLLLNIFSITMLMVELALLGVRGLRQANELVLALTGESAENFRSVETKDTMLANTKRSSGESLLIRNSYLAG